MRKIVAIVCLLLSFSTHSFAEEYSFSAIPFCDPSDARYAERQPGDLFAWKSTGFNQFFCNLPKNVNRGIRGAYVRVKPGYYRTGYNIMGCRMYVLHPYGSGGARGTYGPSVFANGTNLQSLYVTVPSNHNKYGQIVVECSTRSGDVLYGAHLQQ